MATWEDRLFRARRNSVGISVGEAALRRRKQVYCALRGRQYRQAEMVSQAPTSGNQIAPSLVQATRLWA